MSDRLKDILGLIFLFWLILGIILLFFVGVSGFILAIPISIVIILLMSAIYWNRWSAIRNQLPW